MIPLSQRDVLRHLKQLRDNPSVDGVFAGDNERAAMTALLERLEKLVTQHRSAEISVRDLRQALFPHAKETSQRVLFANFRRNLAAAAKTSGRQFTLIQPSLRGKDPHEIRCYFEGDSFGAEPDIKAATQRFLAGLERAPMVTPPAAVLGREAHARLSDPANAKDRSRQTPCKLFLSYAHKDAKLVIKLMERLRTELAISKRFQFDIWSDEQILAGNEFHPEIRRKLYGCDLCLALLSPAYFASEYITKYELPPITEGKVLAIPAALEPLDFDRHDLHSLEKLQVVFLKGGERERAYSQCTGEIAKRFAAHLAEKIEEKLKQVAESEDSGASGSLRGPVNRLLGTRIHADNEPLLVHPPVATGNLGDVMNLIGRQRGEAEDPYVLFGAHRQSAVDYLYHWTTDPDAPPFAVVLGETGSGKTTALRMLARRLAVAPEAPPVIFIDLRDYFGSGDPTLEDLLAEHLRRYDEAGTLTVEDLIYAVRKEKGLIIFDGLDEKIISMSEAARRNFIRELWRVMPSDAFVRPSSSGCGRLIISCRSHYFPDVHSQSSGFLAQDRANVRPTDYLACVMLPWEEQHIRDYLTAMIGSEAVDRAMEMIEAVHNLKDLSTRPYLLHLIGSEIESLLSDRKSGKAIDAAVLYKKFTERWLARDEGKHIFTPVHKRRMMEEIAADLWRAEAREWTWERVEEWLDEFLLRHPAIADAYREQPRALLKQDFRTATLVVRPDGIADAFRFAHTSLQEYFLACRLVRALYDERESHPEAVWNLPLPSNETFAFVGQGLQRLPRRDHDAALVRLRTFMADPVIPVETRVAALRNQVHAHSNNLPAPDRPDVALAGCVLEAWSFCGTAESPLRLGKADFTGAQLLRTTFEFVQFDPGTSWRDADLRGSRFVESNLREADFSDSRLEGAFFRKCDLRSTRATNADRTGVLLHLCEVDPNSGWPASQNPLSPSLLFAQNHSGAITCVAWSPCGRSFATASWDETIKIREARSGFPVATLYGHKGPVEYLAYSPDGTLLASGSRDKTVRVWDTRSGETTAAFDEHKDFVTGVSFLPDGNRVVSACSDGHLRVWDIASQSQIMRSDDRHRITTMSLSPNGENAVTGGMGGHLIVWDLKSNRLLQTLAGHRKRVNCIGFSKDGTWMSSGFYDGIVAIWNFETMTLARKMEGHPGGVNSLVFSPCGIHLFSGSQDGLVKQWNRESGRLENVFSDHTEAVASLAISPDSNHLLSGGWDACVHIRDLPSNSNIRTLSYFPTAITRPFVDRIGEDLRVIWGGQHNLLRCWDYETGRLIRTLRGHRGTILWLARNRSEGLLLTGSTDGTVKVWKTATGDCLRTLKGHQEAVTHFALSPDAKTLVLASEDGMASIRDVESGNLRVVNGDFSFIRRLAFSPSGDRFVSEDAIDEMRCWGIDGYECDLPKGAAAWLNKADETNDSGLECLGHNIIRLRTEDRLLRDILVLPDGSTTVAEPWDETEARKPAYDCRWKLVNGPAETWRYAVAVDRETAAILPPEAAYPD
ncbi:MAG: TIR domain-containing protein [Opitutales bacterium]|nr:TIR domain-containing protein [Opitutales bacterium]